MKNFRLSGALLLTSIIVITIVACQKEKSVTQDPVEQYEMSVSKLSSESDTEAEIIYDGIFDDAMGVNADSMRQYGNKMIRLID